MGCTDSVRVCTSSMPVWCSTNWATSPPCTHSHTHIQTDSLSCAQTHTYTHSHTHIQTYTLSSAQTHTYTHTHTDILSLFCTNTHIYTHSHTHIQTYSLSLLHTHTYTHTVTHTYTQTLSLVHKHTHIHTQSHTCNRTPLSASYHNPVTVHDRRQTMSNGQNSAVSKLGSQNALNLVIQPAIWTSLPEFGHSTSNGYQLSWICH